MKTLAQSMLVTLALTAAASAAQAQEYREDTSSTAESVGVLSGLAIGGLVAGPPGAIVTGAVGAWVGDLYRTQQNHRALATAFERNEAKLLQAQVDRLNLQQQLDSTQLLADLNAKAASKLCCQLGNVELYFRSNSAEIEPHYRATLARFIDASTANPDLLVEVTGHADRRGDPTNNLLLSQRRVESVLQTLRSMGLAQATYQTIAVGEQEPATEVDQSHESNFFDRRVVLRLVSRNNTMLSSTAQ